MRISDESRARLAALEAAERYRQALVGGGDAEAAADELLAHAEHLQCPAAERPDPAATVHTRPASDKGVTRGVSRIDARVRLHMTHVPLSMVDLFDEAERPLVSVTLAPGGETRRIRVRAEVEDFSSCAIQTLEVAKDEPAEKTVHLLPTFARAHAARLTRPVRVTARVLVETLDAARAEDERTFRLWLLPPTTAVLYEKDPSTGVFAPLTNYLAGWVTPDEPAVMGVLRKAAERCPERSIVGYQTDEAGVLAHVRAIFDELKQRGLVYVNSVAASGAADAFVQRIRLPAESLRDSAANCLDGAVLYASLLEAASLQAAIVLITGHAYVAWRARRGGEWRCLETTLTGSATFEEALARAAAAHAKWQSSGETTILDIAELRTRGYLPMA